MKGCMFNIDGGYLEALCRGFKCGILQQTDYLNLVQCETLEGIYLYFQRNRAFLMDDGFADVRAYVLQIWSCTWLVRTTAASWPMSHLPCRSVWSMTSWGKSWWSSSSICVTTRWSRSPSSWISSLTATWLTILFCSLLERCINVPFPNLSPSVIHLAASSKWKLFMLLLHLLNCTMQFW